MIFVFAFTAIAYANPIDESFRDKTSKVEVTKYSPDQFFEKKSKETGISQKWFSINHTFDLDH